MSDINTTYNDLLDEFKDINKKLFDFMESEFSHIHVGRADPNMVADLSILYYDEHVKLKTIAQIQIPEPQKICIKPFERKAIANICKSINESKLDIDVSVDADKIILTMRPLTEETRKQISKKVKVIGDETKQKIRYARRDILQKWKKVENKNDDIDKEFENVINKELKDYNRNVDTMVEKKEKEIMSMKGNN